MSLRISKGQQVLQDLTEQTEKESCLVRLLTKQGHLEQRHRTEHGVLQYLVFLRISTFGQGVFLLTPIIRLQLLILLGKWEQKEKQALLDRQEHQELQGMELKVQPSILLVQLVVQ